MIDVDLIQQCADPSLKVEVVQKFIEEAGGADHLTVTVRAGERIILVPKPSTEDEAMQLIRRNLGQSIVRVGVTQYPAGLGIQDMSELRGSPRKRPDDPPPERGRKGQANTENAPVMAMVQRPTDASKPAASISMEPVYKALETGLSSSKGARWDGPRSGM